MSSPRGRRHGITLLEVLIIIGIVALLISILLPSISRLRQTAGRVPCGSNLRQIGQAILLYANENKGAFPRAIHQPGAMPTWGTGVSAADPFNSPDRPAANDVTAALFLLIRTQGITSEVFACLPGPVTPDDYGGGKNTVMTRSNFTDWRKNLSYSLHNPYPVEPAREGDEKPRALHDATLAIAADMNSGVGDGYDVTAVDLNSTAAEMKKANSRNHDGAGNNILYADGHVEFQQNPFAGTKRDNIFTVAGVGPDGQPTPTSKTVVGPPSWSQDSVLLPAWK